MRGNLPREEPKELATERFEVRPLLGKLAGGPFPGFSCF